MVSSETPRLGPSVVGVSATAERTPGVARASASAAAGSPGPALVMASSPARPACRCWVTAWSMVVELNSRVQLRATVSISGVLADEKRRVAVRRFADARKPPTGESRASGGPSTPAATRATIGPRKPTATTRKSAVISDVAAAVSGALVVAETANSGTAPASASRPPITRPGPSSRGSTAASVSAWVGGTRAARRPAPSTASSAADDSAADGRRDRQPAGADGEVRRGDAVAHEPVCERSAEDGPGPDAQPPSPPGRRSPPPRRSCGGSGRASRPPRAGARSRARAAGSTGPSCWPRRRSR